MSSRSVKIVTLFNILKKKPVPMYIGFFFTLIPTFIIGILMIAFSSVDNGVPSVNHDLIHTNGEEKTGEISGIEAMYNVITNDSSAYIISYFYHGNE